MRIFKTKRFGRFARKERLTDRRLIESIDRATMGLVDADLGGHLIKQRIARSGEGCSGGYRAVIVFRMRDRAVFVFGFAKSRRENLDMAEEQVFKETAKELLSLTSAQLDELVEQGELEEIETDA